MKLIKKITSVIIVFVMVLSIASSLGFSFISPLASAESEEDIVFVKDGITYYLYSDNGTDSLRICDISEDIKGDLVIPETVEGYPVRSVSDYASAKCEGITSISLPSTFTGDILGFNFINSKDFQKFIVDENNPVGYSDEYGVLYNKDKSVLMYIPSGLSLESYTIPESVKEINVGCFARGTSIKAFAVAEGNEYFSTDVNGILFNKDKTEIVRFPENGIRTYTVPESVTTLGACSFSYSENIEEVYIPETVTKASELIFSFCKNLRKIEHFNNISLSHCMEGCRPASKITLGDEKTIFEWSGEDSCATELVIGKTVSDLSRIEYYGSYISAIETFGEITLEEGNETYALVDGVLYDKNVEKLYIFPNGTSRKSYVMPDTVVSISEYFNQFKNLTSVTLGKNFGSNEKTIEEYVNEYGEWMGYRDYYTSIFNYYISLKLEEINVHKDNPYLTSENGILYSKDKKAVVAVPPAKDVEDITFKSDTVVCPFAYMGEFGKVTLSKDFCEYLYNSIAEYYEKYYSKNYSETVTDEMIADLATDILSSILTTVSAEEFIVEEGNGHFSSLDGVLYNSDKTVLIKYPIGNNKTFYAMPDTVTSANIVGMGDVMISPFYSSLFNSITSFSVMKKDKFAVHLSPDFEYKDMWETAGVTSICINEHNETTKIINESVESILNGLSPDIHTQIMYIEKLYLSGMYPKISYEQTIRLNKIYESATITIAACGDDHSVDFTSSNDNVTAEYELGCFGNYDNEVELKVNNATFEQTEEMAKIIASSLIQADPLGVFDISPKDADGNTVQPQSGHKVTVKIKLPKTSTIYDDNPDNDKFIVFHKMSDTGKTITYREPKLRTELINGEYYLVFEVEHFSLFAVCVEKEFVEKTVSSIAIANLPAKTSYTYKKDNLDLTGLALTVTYSDGTTETVTDTSKMTVKGFDGKKAGNQSVTVEYEGATASFDVSVSYAWWQWIIRILLLGFLWY